MRSFSESEASTTSIAIVATAIRPLTLRKQISLEGQFIPLLNTLFFFKSDLHTLNVNLLSPPIMHVISAAKRGCEKIWDNSTWLVWLSLYSKGQYIVSGSDDGSFFIWEKETTNLVRILQGDESIVNCLQPHPGYCFLATSGIDPVVRLWNPRPEVRTESNDTCVIMNDKWTKANSDYIFMHPDNVIIMRFRQYCD